MHYTVLMVYRRMRTCIGTEAFFWFLLFLLISMLYPVVVSIVLVRSSNNLFHVDRRALHVQCILQTQYPRTCTVVYCDAVSLIIVSIFFLVLYGDLRKGSWDEMYLYLYYLYLNLNLYLYLYFFTISNC